MSGAESETYLKRFIAHPESSASSFVPNYVRPMDGSESSSQFTSSPRHDQTNPALPKRKSVNRDKPTPINQTIYYGPVFINSSVGDPTYANLPLNQNNAQNQNNTSALPYLPPPTPCVQNEYQFLNMDQHSSASKGSDQAKGTCI